MTTRTHAGRSHALPSRDFNRVRFRLVSVRRAGTLIARYAYDVLGRRIAKRVYSSASGGVIGLGGAPFTPGICGTLGNGCR